MSKAVEKLSKEDLIEHFEWVVKRNHYDPVSSTKPPHTYDALLDELRRRLAYYDLSAPPP